MEKYRNEFMAEILLGRANLIKILLVAIFVALGVNLIAISFATITGLGPSEVFIVGIALCIISILYLMVRVLRRRVRFHNYEGFLVYHEKDNKIIPVPRYEFSESLNMYIDAVFFENKAIKSIWDREPLKDIFSIDDNVVVYKRLNTFKIISEATEYFVLSTLSTHLTDYFSDEKFMEKNLRKFQRNDVPDVLLKNRFMELFSKPREERTPFVDHVEHEFNENEPGELVYMHSGGGALYERFDLVMPKDSVVRRVEENKIEIETKRFIMCIAVQFDGMNVSLPRNFHKHYLFFDKFEDIRAFQVEVGVQVSFKLGAIFRKTGWEYYQWVDSFLNELDENISKQKFLDSIGWDSALTVIEYLKSQN